MSPVAQNSFGIDVANGFRERVKFMGSYEAKRFGIKMPDEVPMTTQERAYTSPIWYSPGGND